MIASESTVEDVYIEAARRTGKPVSKLTFGDIIETMGLIEKACKGEKS